MERVNTVRLQRSQPTPAPWAAGGLVGAVLASACCIGPLVLVTLGVSGAWIAVLTKLDVVQPIFLAVAVVCIALGFRAARRSAAACQDGAICARPRMRGVTVAALWGASILVALAATVGLWAPYLT